MAMNEEEIVQMIKSALPEAKVRIEDLAGDGDHYSCEVSSPAFEGKSRIAQHQLVYNALGGKMGGDLHAMALKTYVPSNAPSDL